MPSCSFIAAVKRSPSAVVPESATLPCASRSTCLASWTAISRPLASWTAFAVETFECIILGAALVAFFGTLAGNRLPRLYHPVFNAPSFSLAEGNRFYLLVRADDPAYDRGQLRRWLRSWHAVSIEDVAP